MLQPLFGDGRKIAQIGQTESRSCTEVQQEAKFVRSAKHFNLKNVLKRFFATHNFILIISLQLQFAVIIGFLCFVRSGHFATAPFKIHPHLNLAAAAFPNGYAPERPQ